MLKKKALCVLVVLLIPVLFVALPASAQVREDVSDVGEGTLQPATPAPRLVQLRQQGQGPVLYDNGPLVNSPGTGVGGADESVLQDISLGMGTYGWGHQVAGNIWVADDFTATGTGMDIHSITFYAYQTGSATTSPITAYNVRIYDAQPGTPGATVIASSSTITSSTWSNIYRVNETTTGTDTQRPIMATVVDMGGVQLAAGTYWLAWQADGSVSFTGPWAPPITINGQTTTGNGLQSPDNGVTWGNVTDSFTGTEQGFPFIIRGAIQPVPTLSGYGMIIFSMLLAGIAFMALRRRQFAGK